MRAWASQTKRQRVQDVARQQRQSKHCEMALQEHERLEEKWKLQRENLEKARKQEKIQAWKRMQVDKEKREARWTQKMEGHSFHTDLWAEDEQLWDLNQVANAKARTRERSLEKEAGKDQAERRRAKVGEVDQLDILRKEKKKLQEDEKELKARLDLDKVDKRCAAAKYKADMKWDAHQTRLADLGHLDRSHSDFFTDARLNSSQIDQKRQRSVTQQKRQRQVSKAIFSERSLRSLSSSGQTQMSRSQMSLSGPTTASEDHPLFALLDNHYMSLREESLGASVTSDLGSPSPADADNMPVQHEV